MVQVGPAFDASACLIMKPFNTLPSHGVGGMQVGLGEGLAPSSATNVMARQVPECGPCHLLCRLPHQACITRMAVKADSHAPGNAGSLSAVPYANLPSVTLLQHLLCER